ncbi:MAG: phosphatase PAP2 family protein [Gemmataceae bacterium]|nr:phosphatase PAP2 family protein [Gemmataceae bacterium]
MRSLESIDQGVWNGIQARRTPWIDAASLTVSRIGWWPVLLGIVLLAAFWLCLKRRFFPAGLVFGSFVGAVLLTAAMAALIPREPPENVVYPLEHVAGNSSFPSPETLAATATFLALALVMGTMLPGRWRIVAFGAALVLAGLVGLSRLFIGVCYPSDVIAGWVAGLAWALVCFEVQQRAASWPSSIGAPERFDGGARF